MRRRSRVTQLLLLAVIVGTLAGGVTLARHRDEAKPAASPSTNPTTGPLPTSTPVERGLPTASVRPSLTPTGRGRGIYRAIPCYLVTPAQLSKILGSPMALGQRAAGAAGTGLTGNQREDCYWFSTDPAGPYVVISDVTTGQLRDRGKSGWTAQRYFDEVPPKPRTYLSGIGDAAYAYGPGSVAVLVGDVYLDVMVVNSDGHPLTDAVAIARVVARLKLTGP